MIFPGGKKIAKKINQFAKIITPELRKELNNPNIALQFVSAERWRDDEKTTSMKITQHDIYRLQLVGFANDDEIRFAWNKVAERFTPSVIQWLSINYILSSERFQTPPPSTDSRLSPQASSGQARWPASLDFLRKIPLTHYHERNQAVYFSLPCITSSWKIASAFSLALAESF